ncbi:adenylate/guanylate cyclase domain-containing protein [Sneathiella sp.]|uniref:adenylate/guanylate cyclase domain-containing protein n=1 Tax=Sneathiella sp. TaxID=1964365 RepID=UPI0035684DFA
MERRLAAILIADVVDYSRLMGEDEARMLAALGELRHDLFEPVVASHGGNVIKRMGDGWIVEYPNVYDAVASAIEVQESLAKHEIIRMRVGIHSGDVMFQDDDVYGDGINVAARLEALAKPGQVLISDTAHHSLDGRAAAKFGGGKQHELKNIARPVAVWNWPVGSELTAAQQVAPALSDKPSIAVLPLNCMSADPEHEYLADGLSEDLTTLLARVPDFFVVARNSSFSFKGEDLDISEVGRALNVRYAIAGSLRPVGKLFRVTAQLIDTETGQHIWSKHFDHPSDTIYELQDEIISAIVSNLLPELTRMEFERIQRRPLSDFNAWTYYQKASGLLAVKGWRKETFTAAAELYRRSIALDEQFAPAYAGLSLLLALGHLVGYVSEPDEALAAADRALALDNGNSEVLGYAGCALTDLGFPNRGIEILEQALDLDPSNAQAMVALGSSFFASGKIGNAVEFIRHGLELSPRDSRQAFWRGIFALALSRHGKLENGIEEARNACRVDSSSQNSRVILAALLMRAERQSEAASALKEARRIHPELSHREVQGLVGRKNAALLEAIW